MIKQQKPDAKPMIPKGIWLCICVLGGKLHYEKGLNFRTIENQKEYFEAYEKALKLIAMPVVEKYVTTSFGDSHVINERKIIL